MHHEYIGGSVSETKLKSIVLSVHGDVDFTGRFLLEKARTALRDVFGWELATSRKTLTLGKLFSEKH